MTTSYRRGPRGDALVIAVLVALALIPAFALAAIARWADGRAPDSAPDSALDSTAESAVTTAPAATTLSAPTLTTPVLSMRRTAPQLARQLNESAFAAATQPLVALVDDRSCVMVSVDGQVAGARHEDQAVIPASNQKVLVAAVALDVLGTAFTYTTTLVGPAPTGATITGDVYLVGGGDPLLSGGWYEDAEMDTNPAFNTTVIDDLARQLQAAGVTQIDGTLRGDASRYDDEWYVDSWGADVAGIEAGPYDALIVNDARVRGDDVRASDPIEAAVREFARILADYGITITGGTATGTAPADSAQLAAVSSQPLPAVITEMLTNSDNNTAELMLKEIGFAATGVGSRQAGLDTIAATLSGWGIDTASLVLADGSGLSLDNRVTCRQLVGVLRHVGVASAVGQGLAVAGETGTLASAFEGTAVDGRLRGKTGTLNNYPIDADPPAVKSLSGFLPVDGGGAIEFALILNGPTISDRSEYVPIWDQLATTLASYPAGASAASLGPR